MIEKKKHTFPTMFHIKETKYKEAHSIEEAEDLGELLRTRSQFSIEALTRKALQQHADFTDLLKAQLLAAANSGLDHCDIAWQTLLNIDQVNPVTRQTFDDQQCFQLFSTFLTTLLKSRIISIAPIESNTLTIRFSWTCEETLSQQQQECNVQKAAEKTVLTKKKSLLHDNFAKTDFNYRFAASTDKETQSKKFEESISYF